MKSSEDAKKVSWPLVFLSLTVFLAYIYLVFMGVERGQQMLAYRTIRVTLEEGSVKDITPEVNKLLDSGRIRDENSFINLYELYLAAASRSYGDLGSVIGAWDFSPADYKSGVLLGGAADSLLDLAAQLDALDSTIKAKNSEIQRLKVQLDLISRDLEQPGSPPAAALSSALESINAEKDILRSEINDLDQSREEVQAAVEKSRKELIEILRDLLIAEIRKN